MTSFYPDLPTAAGLAAALVVMVCVPGWALLSVAGRLDQWSTLQKWALAVGLSLSLYPVALYWLRSAPAWVKLGRWELIGVLALAAGVIAWRHWPPRRPAFSGSGAIALLVVAGTLATRFWIIRDQPFPASPDSLHHTLLTQLTAVAGRLPQTLEPYFPIPLALYHLGLYALSGPAQILSGAPAHTALLWTAQLLNGLSGVGVFLLLDRRIGRLSAILGAVVVGLWSFQPAWLVSWGRFTPVAAQTVLPFAWLLTWQALEAGRQAEWTGRSVVRLIGLAGLTNAAVFLLHFRVAVYLLPLLAMTAIVELWRAHRAGALRRSALILGGVAGASLVLAAPAVWDALSAYYSLRSASWTATQSLEAVEAWRQGYYAYTLNDFLTLGARAWLWAAAAAAAMVGLWRRNSIAILAVVWLATLWGLGSLYLLEVPLLAFTNMAAVLFSVYLPIGFLVGAGIGEAAHWIGPAYRPAAGRAVLGAALLSGAVAGRARATEVIPHYYYVTPADFQAMDWIRVNVPAEAVFAINIWSFIPEVVHGTDAGYWIPYFTGRQTTAACMLYSLGDRAYVQSVLDRSQAARRLESDPAAIDDLRRMGVTHLYLGQNGDFPGGGPGLQAETLRRLPGVELLYQDGPVAVLAINP